MLIKWFGISAKCALLSLLFVGSPISSAMAREPALVFLLAGQSNMGGVTEEAARLVNSENEELLKQLGTNLLNELNNIADPLPQDGENWTDVPDNVKIWPYTQKSRLNGNGPPYLYVGEKWLDLDPKLGLGNDVGPELSFGRAMSFRYPDRDIYLIKYASGGKHLDGRFSPGAPDLKINDEKSPENGEYWGSVSGEKGFWYQRLVQNTKNALQRLKEDSVDYEMAGFLWMQGENDARVLTFSGRYQKNLYSLVEHVRDLEYGGKKYPRLPFLIGRITRHYGSIDDKSENHRGLWWVENNNKRWYQKPDSVRLAQENVANTTINSTWINTDHLKRHRGDTPNIAQGHYDLQSQLKLGNLFADAYDKPAFDTAWNLELVSVLSLILDQSVIGGVMSGAVTASAETDAVPQTSGTLTIADSDTGESRFNVQDETGGLYGKFSIDDDGLWTYTLNNTNTDVMALRADEILRETFTVTSLDSLATANVTITITGINDPPTAGSVTVSGTEDNDLTFTAADFTNATAYDDVDGDSLDRIRIVSLPVITGTVTGTGTLKLDGAVVTVPVEVSATEQLDLGKLTFTPAENWNGAATFDYLVSDGNDWSTESNTVTITVNSVNDPPTVFRPSLTISEGWTVTITTQDLGVTDPDDDNGAVSVQVSEVNLGGFMMDGGIVTEFTLDNVVAGNVTFVHDGGESAPEFSVQAKDDETGSGYGTAVSAAVTFTNVNDEPTADDFRVFGPEDTDLTPFDTDAFTNAFADVDGDTPDRIRIFPSFNNQRLPSTGTLKLNGTVVDTSTGTLKLNGTVVDTNFVEFSADNLDKLIFTPPENWSGSSNFTYRAFDGHAWSFPMKTVFMTINNVNDPPELSANADLALTVNFGVSGAIGSGNLLTTDVDNSPGELTYTVTQVPTHGSLLLNGGALGVGDTFTQANITAGNLRYDNDKYNQDGTPNSTPEFELSQINALNGIVLNGANIGERAGWSVSSAGDVNDDGFGDILIGAPYADASSGKRNSGVTYLIYGGKGLGSDGLPINLASLGDRGVVINGADGEYSGWSVSGAGNVNNDAFGDILIGAYRGNEKDGRSYLIYGGASLDDSINLTDLGGRGVVINGADDEYSGYSVSGAGGEVNDGDFGDVIIGAPHGGASYLIHGGNNLQPIIDLADLDSADGVIINGRTNNSGFDVSSAGDVNGDGHGDILIGEPSGMSGLANTAYLIYGGENGLAGSGGSINLAELGNRGVVISGAVERSGSYWSVSGAGDVNGDGSGDIIIGTPRDNVTYLIYGGDNLKEEDQNGNLVPIDSIDLENLGSRGVVITGAVEGYMSGYSVSGMGDVNGDGYGDILIGVPGANASYLIYGGEGLSATMDLSALGSADGLVINGAIPESFSGYSVSWVGDVNGDGFGDILIGAPTEADVSPTFSGSGYVVFGKPRSADAEEDFFDFEVTDLDTLPPLSGRFEINVGPAP